ncbi:MAG: hypothetical protein FAZ92_02380 [Accumulibacter sp.]|uniref:DUF642 domain-containing protein n=1 Tax=Accumulibacter sp. TaxID=2053492 RepID=UPI0011F9612C|nr:DUF642 domain-containing protein [Accumulibacter sp.]QKS30544.1 MAG: DUF642 domain-containing protein [Candidatus Accumulibacter similis]TLD45340.1 MAG: hypothetical protein FAZ92_02380 [Accumulibacter sp.]
MKSKLLFAAVVAAAVSGGAHAAPFFSDDFQSSTEGGNTVPSGWTVSAGTVEVLGQSFFGGLCNGSVSEKCVDLDGSSGNAGILSRVFSLTAGNTYTLSFDLAGNRRGAGTETGTVSFGTSVLNFSVPQTQTAYLSLSLLFSPGSDGAYTLSFANDGGDNMGAILDNVVITVDSNGVPVPGTLGLLAAGMLAGLAAKRRRS